VLLQLGVENEVPILHPVNEQPVARVAAAVVTSPSQLVLSWELNKYALRGLGTMKGLEQACTIGAQRVALADKSVSLSLSKGFKLFLNGSESWIVSPSQR